MIVIFSRAEIDVKDTFKQMESMDPDMSPQERLTEVFGTQAATPEQANVLIENGVISYHLEEDGPSLLPLVFNINRR